MKITSNQYQQFCKNYGKDPNDKYLRFGQKFCNQFNIHDSELFYVEKSDHAKQIIMSKYVEY